MRSDPAAVTSELRIRQNMHGTLARKFMESMKEYQGSQVKYKADMKKKVTRQVKVVNPDATDDQINEVISTGDTSQVFRTVSHSATTTHLLSSSLSTCLYIYISLSLSLSLSQLFH